MTNPDANLITEQKIYKLQRGCYINIHPGDLNRLPDDYFYNSVLMDGGFLWKKQ